MNMAVEENIRLERLESEQHSHGHRRKQAQRLMDDTVQVLESAHVVVSWVRLQMVVQTTQLLLVFDIVSTVM